MSVSRQGRGSSWPVAPGPAAIYLHFPFCVRQCTYCDFPTVIGHADRVQPYVNALVREIRSGQTGLPRDVETVYLGGGTPSRMTVEQLVSVLDAVRDRFELDPGAEVTLECNPEDLDPMRLTGFRDAGINRVSLGVQSFRADVLRSVGRLHDVDRAFLAMDRVRAVDGLRLSVDLIAGLPGDRFDDWEERLDAVVRNGATHLSIYSLEIDKQTPLRKAIDAGRVQVPGPSILVDLYRRTAEHLQHLDFAQYEIASYCRPGEWSRHNLKYWSDDWYGGFGLGAHAYLEGTRRRNRADLVGYLSAVERDQDPVAEIEPWNPRDRIADAIIAGLRPLAGVDLVQLGSRYGVNLTVLLESTMATLIREGGVVFDGSRLALSEKGRLGLDPILARVLEALAPLA